MDKIKMGSLVAVSNTVSPGRWLGLAVDQKAGRRWAAKDPCIEYNLSENHGPLLVRVLGLKLTEGEALGRSGLPEQEPRRTETVRWAFVQTVPNPPWVVAGPDLHSIAEFHRQCRISRDFEMHGATFIGDLALLEEYLRGVERKDSAISYFEKKFFAMLNEVLPQ